MQVCECAARLLIDSISLKIENELLLSVVKFHFKVHMLDASDAIYIRKSDIRRLETEGRTTYTVCGEKGSENWGSKAVPTKSKKDQHIKMLKSDFQEHSNKKREREKNLNKWKRDVNINQNKEI